MKIADYVGYGFRGVRKDSRVFTGVVENVREMLKGTLVVIRQADGARKSFYMHDITGGWSCSLLNGQPILVR